MTTAIRTPEISRRGMLAGLGGMSFCLAFGADDPHEAPAFVLHHRALRHDQRLLGSGHDLHAHVLPGKQLQPRIGQHGAHLHRS